MIVGDLIQRDPAGRLWLTKEGRAGLTALLAKARPIAMAGFKDLIEPMTASSAWTRGRTSVCCNATLRFRVGP
jgi:hypothetical protein